MQAAQHLKREVKAKLGLSLSCGLGPTKLLARVVGPLNKPDGFTLLPHAAARAFLDGLPLKQIPSLRWDASSHRHVFESEHCVAFNRHEQRRRKAQAFAGEWTA